MMHWYYTTVNINAVVAVNVMTVMMMTMNNSHCIDIFYMLGCCKLAVYRIQLLHPIEVSKDGREDER